MKVRLFNKNLFQKKISICEAEEILGISKMKHKSMHMLYLIWEVPLTETRVFGKQEMFLYKDEVLNLRDSINEKLQIVRRNAFVEKHSAYNKF